MTTTSSNHLSMSLEVYEASLHRYHCAFMRSKRDLSNEGVPLDEAIALWRACDCIDMDGRPTPTELRAWLVVHSSRGHDLVIGPFPNSSVANAYRAKHGPDSAITETVTWDRGNAVGAVYMRPVDDDEGPDQPVQPELLSELHLHKFDSDLHYSGERVTITVRDYAMTDEPGFILREANQTSEAGHWMVQTDSGTTLPVFNYEMCEECRNEPGSRL